jgi:hypothetical protein
MLDLGPNTLCKENGLCSLMYCKCKRRETNYVKENRGTHIGKEDRLNFQGGIWNCCRILK